MTARGLQARYAPESICFGCGPANAAGLRIDSVPEGDELVAEWTSSPHHQAFPGVLNGGICGALLDCHSNWTAAWHLMRERAQGAPPTCVTSDFHVALKRPTPVGVPLRIVARAVETAGDRVTVEARIEANIDGATKVTATCRGTFVAVKEGHPAFGRW